MVAGDLRQPSLEPEVRLIGVPSGALRRSKLVGAMGCSGASLVVVSMNVVLSGFRVVASRKPVW